MGSQDGGQLDWVTYWVLVTELGVGSEGGDWGVETYLDEVTG